MAYKDTKSKDCSYQGKVIKTPVASIGHVKKDASNKKG